ncbi:MAG: cold shock domain-containing protein [Nocardioides sp.]|uniref:cold-shock protein n=1 Tax=Nocardioides sp. TaxID=35761 RepID=UPI0039E246F9
MPTGKVKWFDAEKGFGFLSQDDGPDVYVHTDSLPEGTAGSLKPGTRVEFGIAQGRRGDHALSVRVLEKKGSVSRNQAAARRKKPDEMVPIIEDLTKILERIGEGYRHGRHPDPKIAKQVGKGLRTLADEFDEL